MLINLRNALMAGRRLPFDNEVEYLESTGTQWIDTGMYGNSDTVAELTFAMTDSAKKDAGIFGARKGYLQDCFVVLRVQSSNGAFWMHYGNESTSANYISTVIGNTTAWHTARLARSWSIDSSTGTAGQYTFTTPTTLKVFAADMSASGRWYAKMRLASLKIYSNNLLVRDLIPVRKGTVGYLYDRVSGKLFGNEGTGDFVLGPDVVPVEWLESNGGQYIDSGIIPQFPDELTLDATVSFSDTTNRNIQGRQGFFYFGPCRGHLQPGLPSLDYVDDVALSPDTWYNIQCTFAPTTAGANAPVYYNVDGITGSVTTQFANTPVNGSVWLFTANNATNLRGQNKIARYNIRRSGTILRKFLPVRVGTEGAMIDTLTRRIYRNAGTGAFTYGNDLKYPIPAE